MTDTVAEEALADITTTVLVRAGVPETAAGVVTDNLLFADRRGTHSHGVIRLDHYVERIESGGVDPVATLELVKDHEAVALLDGGNGLGAPMGRGSMEIAIDRARRYGVGVAVVRNVNHYGAAGYYSALAAEQRMIGLSMTNVTASMAPTGASRPVVGNNPIAFAFPAGGEPIIWDAATSASSWGALLVAAQEGRPLAEGAFLGPDGRPTTDPAQVMAGGSLIPIAGYKGYGLALCIALLTGVLADAPFDPALAHPYRELAAPGENSALMLALDVERFAGADRFEQTAAAVVATVHSSPSVDGAAVLVPGEREADAARASARNGITLPAGTVPGLLSLAERLGVLDAAERLRATSSVHS